MSQSHDTVKACSENECNVGLISTIFLWLAGALVVPTVMTGQMFIPDVDPFSAIGIVFIGSIFGCIALSSIAAIGTRTGLTTFVYARNVFGTSGAKAFAVLNLVLLMGWGIIQGYLGGIALNKVLSIWFGFDNIVLSIIVTQGLVLFVTMLGHSGIQKIEGWASGLMLILALGVIYYLLDMNGLTNLKEVPLSETPGLTSSIVFDIVLATAFSWMALPCDYNRYCKSVKTSVAGISIGYMVGTLVAMGLGILVASISILNGQPSTYDPSELLTPGFAAAASLVMFLSVVTTNIMTLYSITMSAMSLSRHFSFKSVVFFFGAIALLASLLQDLLMASFFDWVLLVGAFMIPVFAIMLVDYYALKNTNLTENVSINISVVALIAYVVSVFASLYFTYVHPLEFVTAFTFVFSGGLYFSLSKVAGVKASKAVA